MFLWHPSSMVTQAYLQQKPGENKENKSLQDAPSLLLHSITQSKYIASPDAQIGK